MSDRRVAQTFAQLADTLVERFDSVEFLHVLAERSVELLPVNAAGILLANDGGKLELVAASTHLARPLEELLSQSGDGPSEECFRSGQMVRCPDLRARPPRWSRFAAVAVPLGFAAVDAVPMRLRNEVIGSLTLFRMSPGALPAEAEALARSFSNVATISLFQARAASRAQPVAEQLQTTLSDRVLIEQAKGVLMERLEIEVADALSLMRNYARNTGQLLADVARQVTERSPEVAGLTRISKPRPRW
ncbi:GAF and ANTAR domain-containing protein [Lentzea cavernae]|uniref:GAF and ANTAR domain-containing protein n=1 Tax=Lentzea cavernae TaxID=2020703 RepID=UPI00174E1732|nr:GAF and ANTAR domain-containing protein [Lentzea cavernae]